MTTPIAVPEPGPERIEITVPAGTVIEVNLGVTIPPPDQMSIRVHNRKGASDCYTAP